MDQPTPFHVFSLSEDPSLPSRCLSHFGAIRCYKPRSPLNQGVKLNEWTLCAPPVTKERDVRSDSTQVAREGVSHEIVPDISGEILPMGKHTCSRSPGGCIPGCLLGVSENIPKESMGTFNMNPAFSHFGRQLGGTASSVTYPFAYFRQHPRSDEHLYEHIPRMNYPAGSSMGARTDSHLFISSDTQPMMGLAYPIYLRAEDSKISQVEMISKCRSLKVERQ